MQKSEFGVRVCRGDDDRYQNDGDDSAEKEAEKLEVISRQEDHTGGSGHPIQVSLRTSLKTINTYVYRPRVLMSWCQIHDMIC